MKKILLGISILMTSASMAQAQWTPLNSTTIETLNDVDFLSPSYGVIVGNAGTILLTTDGGLTWNDICYHNISGDVMNVKVTGVDTIFVSNFDWAISTGIIYYTTDAGVNWSTVAVDATMNHRIDLETQPNNSEIFASTSYLVSSSNAGTMWDTLVSNVAGTVSADLLRFADNQTGSLSGNVSGFIGYSAYFYMTRNGADWYRGESTLFPNADAHTTMCFANADTAYFFMNQYAGWAPGPLNRLVRVWNFNQSVPFAGDTVYTFNSTIVDTLPDYMNDARFENVNNGLALGNNGKIYRTVNGGTSWTVDYADTCATCPMLKMDFEGGVGYAVGESGILVKYDVTTGVNNNENANELNCSIYPNPSQGIIKIKTATAEPVKVEIVDVLGNVVTSSVMSGNVAIDMTGEAKGLYFVHLYANGKSVTKKIVVE